MTHLTHIRLPGCRPEPLIHYLKGLAVLRLLGQHLGSSAVRACWVHDEFYLESPLTEAELIDFFLDTYRPTPVIAPWNGAGGFWDDKVAGQALRRMEASTGERFAPYRTAIRVAREVLSSLGLEAAPKDDDKARLLRALRARLPDEALDWLDAAVALTARGPEYAPILGTGGNDGRLDFTANFLQRLADVLPLGGAWAGPGPRRPRKGDGPIRAQSAAWLRAALFGAEPPPLLRAALGQFHPGGAGGPNATAGMEGDALVNPWEFILMIEGALALAAAVSRRMGSAGAGRAALPFTVTATAAGWGTLSEQDASKARAEVWLPLWHQPASWGAVRQLFAEGRAEINRRQAQSGLDFVRAVASLGVDRMIDQFQRYGFLERNGMAYLAVPLGRVRVRSRPQVRLVDELEDWLNHVRREASAEAPGSLRRALRQVERAIWAYAEREERGALLDALVAVAEAEQIVARSRALQEKIPPIRPLSRAWLDATDDGSTEFAVASALASIYGPAEGPSGPEVWPLRHHWLPLQQARGTLAWTDPAQREVDLTNLLPAMVTMLERRLLVQEQTGGRFLPIRAYRPLGLHHLHAFLEGRTDDQRIARLLPALSLIDWRQVPAAAPDPPEVPPLLNRAYALLKPLFWPGPLQPRQLGGTKVELRAPSSILARLRAGDLEGPVAWAVRRLLAAGLRPVGFTGRSHVPLKPPAGSTLRLAAALLLPLRSPQSLFDLMLAPSEDAEH
jgi:CRISPR-associated protein Csx17